VALSVATNFPIIKAIDNCKANRDNCDVESQQRQRLNGSSNGDVTALMNNQTRVAACAFMQLSLSRIAGRDTTRESVREKRTNSRGALDDDNCDDNFEVSCREIVGSLLEVGESLSSTPSRHTSDRNKRRTPRRVQLYFSSSSSAPARPAFLGRGILMKKVRA